MRNFEKYEKELKEIGTEFALNKHGIYVCGETECDECVFVHLTDECGNLRMNWLYEEYVEPPCKPKKFERYWVYLVRDCHAIRYVWMDTTEDYSHWKLGNCFRTQEEAETKGKEIMEKIKKEYEES